MSKEEAAARQSVVSSHNEEVRTAYTESRTGDAEAAARYIERGDAYIEKKNYDRAIADYSEAIRLNPNDDAAYKKRSYGYVEKGNFSAAITDLTEAIRIDPAYSGYYALRGHVYFTSEDYDTAIPDFTEAIRLWPRDPSTVEIEARCYSERGRAYCLAKKKDYKQAIADLEEAIKLNPDHEDYPQHLAEAKKLAGKGKKRLIRMGIGAVIGFVFSRVSSPGSSLDVSDLGTVVVFALVGLIFPVIRGIFRFFSGSK